MQCFCKKVFFSFLQLSIFFLQDDSFHIFWDIFRLFPINLLHYFNYEHVHLTVLLRSFPSEGTRHWHNSKSKIIKSWKRLNGKRKTKGNASWHVNKESRQRQRSEQHKLKENTSERKHQ